MGVSESRQAFARWFRVEWGWQQQRRYKRLHEWRRKRAYLARGEGRLLLCRGDDDGCKVALVDLDHCSWIMWTASHLDDALRAADTWVGTLPASEWEPLPMLPEPSDEGSVIVCYTR